MIFGYFAEAAWMLAKCYVCFQIISAFSLKRYSNWFSVAGWSFLSGGVIVFDLIMLFNTNLVSNNFTMLAACIILSLMSLLFFKADGFSAKIFGIWFLFELDEFTDYFTQTILYVFLDTADEGSPRLFQNIGPARGILLCIYSVVLCSFGIKIAKSYVKYVLPTWISTWKGLLLVPVFWFINRYFQRVYVQSMTLVTDSYFFAWMLILLFLFMSILLSWILYRRTIRKAEEKVQEIRFEALQQEMQKTIENNQERRKLVHDIKNNLILLKAYLDDGKIDKAKEFLREILPENTGVQIYQWSGFQILDMVIGFQIESARKEGIRCEVFCDRIHDLMLLDSEICSLFGNLLMNAIEAQKGDFQQEKWIKLVVRQEKEIMYIDISNPYEREIIYENGKIHTSKKDDAFHGVGLSIINYIVDKYGGEILIDTENHIFRTKIFLRAARLL